MVIGAKPAIGELDRVGFAGDDALLLPHGRDHGAVAFIFGGQCLGTAGERPIPLGAEDVLYGYGQALQRTIVPARAKSLVGRIGLRQELVGPPVPVGGNLVSPLIVAGDGLFGDFARARDAVAQRVGDVGQGIVDRVAHGSGSPGAGRELRLIVRGCYSRPVECCQAH